MTKSEAIIRSILGVSRMNINPLVYSIEVALDLMFNKNIPMDDILVSKDIYPAVAKKLNKSACAVSRQVERLANVCWDAIAKRKLIMKYIGADINDIQAPKDIIFYLAFYVYFDLPFFTVIERQPALLF